MRQYKLFYLSKSSVNNTHHLSPIITVTVYENETLEERAKEELDRPGREAYYQKWVNDGMIVQLV